MRGNAGEWEEVGRGGLDLSSKDVSVYRNVGVTPQRGGIGFK